MLMSFRIKICGHRNLPSRLPIPESFSSTFFSVFLIKKSCIQKFNTRLHFSRISTRFNSQKLAIIRSSMNSDANDSGPGMSNADGYSAEHEDSSSTEKNASRQRLLWSSSELLRRLRRYGTSGLLAYGLLNTAYYLTTFLFVWFYVAPTPGKMGYFAAVGRFLKVMAMVWAGSQVTKLARAGGALALAPIVDKGLSWFTIKFKLESQGKAFMAIAGLCFGLALMLFFIVTLLWA